MTFAPTMTPKSLTFHAEKVHFARLTVMRVYWRHWRTRCERLSCSERVLPKIKFLAVMFITSLKPCRARFICRWKYCEAEHIPKGRRWKEEWRNGAIKAVSSWHSSASLTWCKLAMALSLEKTRAYPTCPNVCLTLESMCRVCVTSWLRRVKPSQMRYSPDGFGTTTPDYISEGPPTR